MATREATIPMRVAAGAALLDTLWDYGSWEAEIKLDRLDMSVGAKAWNDTSEVPCGCILMQLYGSYVEGTTELGIHGGEAEELGFEAMGSPLDKEYAALKAAWGAVIANRRVANQVIPDLGGYDA